MDGFGPVSGGLDDTGMRVIKNSVVPITNLLSRKAAWLEHSLVASCVGEALL